MDLRSIVTFATGQAVFALHLIPHAAAQFRQPRSPECGFAITIRIFRDVMADAIDGV
jgi:hypothetical protein